MQREVKTLRGGAYADMYTDRSRRVAGARHRRLRLDGYGTTGRHHFFFDEGAGARTLVITKAQLVLRELELKLSESSTCSTGTVEDSCEEIELGPMLIDLPVTDAVMSPISATVPAGTYREIEFDIRRPGTDPADIAFVDAHPEFANVSIRLEGTYNGTPFVFTSELDQEVQIDFNPDVVITEANNNVTIAVDIRAWFTGAGGALIDPATANPGEPNESIVSEKIKASLRAFEDDDKNGT
jgi:hypothetical protein